MLDRELQFVASSDRVMERATGVAFAEDGRIFATDSFERDLVTFDENLAVIDRRDIGGWFNGGIDLTPDGDVLFVSLGDGVVYLYDFESEQTSAVISGFGFGIISDVLLLPSGDLAVMGNGTRLWTFDSAGSLLAYSDDFDPRADGVGYFIPRYCLGDVAPPPLGDGEVGPADVVAALEAFGETCDACREDIMPPGGDGRVSIADVVAVIAHLGECE